MEGNLNFHAEGDYFVTEPLTGGENGCVAFQIVFDDAGADVIVEYAVFPELGWKAASSYRAAKNHPDVISGVLEGISVRIRTSVNPVVAKYKTI